MKKLLFRLLLILLWLGIGPLWLGVGIFIRDYLPELVYFYKLSFEAFLKGEKV